MIYKNSYVYEARPVDEKGDAAYSQEDNEVWHTLLTRQRPIVNNRGCDEYLQGLTLLDLPTDRVPQCPELSLRLQALTGWSVQPVPAMIPLDQFFYLLANKQFPAATFIRRKEEIDYLQEPDIFHEIFGHCPMLTNQAYADFTEYYGKLGLTAKNEDRIMLGRLFWFTNEFGLIRTNKGLRTYGGGILSSKNETIYCIESPIPERKPFDVIEALRTPYRIDIMQPIYFVIDHFEVLFELAEMDLIAKIQEARRLGDHKPSFEPINTGE